MKRWRNLCWISAGTVLLLVATSTQLWAVAGVGGPAAGLGVTPLGGELRGITGVNGRVLCAQCDLEEVRAAQPDLIGLYELQHRQGHIVMQLNRPQEASQAAYWESVVGLGHNVSVRAPDYVFAQLMAEENLNRPVGIQGLLRSSRTYDISDVKFLEGVRSPLAPLSGLSAADRAAATPPQD